MILLQSELFYGPLHTYSHPHFWKLAYFLGMFRKLYSDQGMLVCCPPQYHIIPTLVASFHIVCFLWMFLDNTSPQL